MVLVSEGDDIRFYLKFVSNISHANIVHSLTHTFLVHVSVMLHDRYSNSFT